MISRYDLTLLIAIIVTIITLMVFFTNYYNPDVIEQKNDKRKLDAIQTDLEDCSFVESSCPFVKLDQKLDRIIELLEKNQ